MNFITYGGSPNAKISIEKKAEKDGVLFFDVDMILEEEAVPQQFTVCWNFPIIDTLSTWSPTIKAWRYLAPHWKAQRTTSRTASWMPIHCHFSRDGRNRQTVAVADAKTPISLLSGANDNTAELYCAIEFFTNPVAPIKEYHTTIRIDLRHIPYEQAIRDVTKWWETDCGYTPAFVPEYAKYPMNSTWYSYHRDLAEDDLLRECALSKPLGMETILIDDGWQRGEGHHMVGDWMVNADKFPAFKLFVDKVHEIGMKVMVWFSVPFLGKWSALEEGKENPVYTRFKDMVLNGGTDGFGDTFHFDPRYKEVRDYLVDIYVSRVQEWGIDGLKLDFIDWFNLTDISLKPDDRRDIKSLEEAIDTLMLAVHDALIKVKPDILIEFRETYVGPCIRQYGNMLRVIDCPNDALINRGDTINLRLISGDTAIHSDMLMWNVNEPVENAAMQITNCIFSVPQISMRIQELPEDHKKMLGFYLDFWRKNRDILAYGDIFAKNPEFGYSMAYAVKDKEAVFALYADTAVDIEDMKTAKIINSTRLDALIVENAEGKDFEVVNCMGEVLKTGRIENNVIKINVPLSGIIFIK